MHFFIRCIDRRVRHDTKEMGGAIHLQEDGFSFMHLNVNCKSIEIFYSVFLFDIRSLLVYKEELMQRVEIFLMNRFQDLVPSTPVCTTPTSIRSCTRNMLSGLLTFGSATAGPYEKRNGVQCTTGDRRIIGAKGKPIQSIFCWMGSPLRSHNVPRAIHMS